MARRKAYRHSWWLPRWDSSMCSKRESWIWGLNYRQPILKHLAGVLRVVDYNLLQNNGSIAHQHVDHVRSVIHDFFLAYINSFKQYNSSQLTINIQVHFHLVSYEAQASVRNHTIFAFQLTTTRFPSQIQRRASEFTGLVRHLIGLNSWSFMRT